MTEELFDLTTPQKAIITMEQFYPGTSMNNIVGKITIHEKVDFAELKKAIRIFVKNTDNIRYQLHIDQDIIKQYKKEYETFKIDHVVLNSQNSEEICTRIARTPFELFDMPLYRFTTFENEDETGGFILCVHHLLTDAWSVSSLISTIVSTYSKIIKNEKIEIDNNLYPYTDFIKEENEYLQSPKFKQDEEFWEDLFSENIFEDNLSGNSQSNLTYEATRVEFKLSKKMTSKIVDFCKEIKISPFTFLLYVMAIYESKVKQTNNVVLSTPILNRSGKKQKETFGLFVNNMLYKLNIEENTSFYDAITDLNKSQFSYLRHQKYPLQELITNIKSRFQIKENIYNTSVSYQNARTIHEEGTAPYDSEWLFSGYLTIPLVFHIYDMDDTSSFSFMYDYQNKMYDFSQIKDIHNRLLHICEQIMENKNILIKDIELTTEEEREKILNEFNNTKVTYDRKKTILDLWEKEVKLHPEKIAIICGEKEVSYLELDKESEKLAGYLQNEYHVKKGRNISIILDRSIDLVVALLAILKCGCSYVLIDTSHPEDRKKYMIENSNSEYVISDLDLKLPNQITWNLNTKIDEKQNYKKVEINPEDPMYLLYTSGSTGLPKAVTIAHRNFHNYLVRNIKSNRLYKK